jgi:DNA-binding HxlR family transcriptional regulator
VVATLARRRFASYQQGSPSTGANDSIDYYLSESIAKVANRDKMNSRRIYRHFCMMARALEIVGERWTLLIVRDLLLGPRRFTDLVNSLDDITPTRLTARLRQLEAMGLVTREPPTSGREVWYRLTGAGQALQPAIEALIFWGQEFAFERPVSGEGAHAVSSMIGTKVWLNGQPKPRAKSLLWVWRLEGEGAYSMRFKGGSWELTEGETGPADVIVDTSASHWAHFFTSPQGRKLPSPDLKLTGKRAAIATFTRIFKAELAEN